ncbi:MAG: hypothetical protein II931_00440, partial [Clostridia bacterium]|nr:hypothetical protein [Clostridia bacterium]
SVNALTVIQIITGAAGIIIAAAVNAEKTADKARLFRVIPFVCGIITCIFGGISYLSLLLSKSSSVFFCVVMFLTVLVIPVTFTVFSNRFRKGDKN